MATQLRPAITVKFSERLLTLRKVKGYTQQSLADASGIHVQQIKRYETRTAQPSVEALIKLAKTLGVSTDSLLFDPAERGPSDDLRLQFEALSQFSTEEKKIAMAVIEGLILKHHAQRFAPQEISA